MPWWYISCDLDLIVGTFIDGLVKYKVILNDEELPFGRRIAQSIISDSGSAQAFGSFRVEARAARKVFDDAFSAVKCKAQAESDETIAAVVAESKLFADQFSMIEQGSTTKDSKINSTCNTDKP